MGRTIKTGRSPEFDGTFVLGLDPAMAKCGWAVVQLLPATEKITAVGVVRTQKSDKKLNVKATCDNFRRMQEIATALELLLKRYCPMVITAEAMSYPPNAAAAGKIMSVWGIISVLSLQYQLPVLQTTPGEIKQVLCGKASASKKEVITALDRMYPGQFDAFRKAVPAGKWDNGYDAVGSVVACFDTDVLRMARRTT